MTISNIVSKLKALLKEHDASPGVFGDQMLYEMFVSARAELLSQRLGEYKYISPKHYQTFCIKLLSALSHECGCITHGCDVLKSEYDIPGYLSGPTKPTLKVHGLGLGYIIDEVKESELDIIQLNDIKKVLPVYTITNNKLVIWNNTTLKGLQLTAIWEDVTEWTDKQYCPNNTDCIDIFSMDLGIDKKFEIAIYKKIFEILKVPLSLKEDITTDANSEIRM